MTYSLNKCFDRNAKITMKVQFRSIEDEKESPKFKKSYLYHPKQQNKYVLGDSQDQTQIKNSEGYQNLKKTRTDRSQGFHNQFLNNRLEHQSSYPTTRDMDHKLTKQNQYPHNFINDNTLQKINRNSQFQYQSNQIETPNQCSFSSQNYKKQSSGIYQSSNVSQQNFYNEQNTIRQTDVYAIVNKSEDSQEINDTIVYNSLRKGNNVLSASATGLGKNHIKFRESFGKNQQEKQENFKKSINSKTSRQQNNLNSSQARNSSSNNIFTKQHINNKQQRNTTTLEQLNKFTRLQQINQISQLKLKIESSSKQISNYQKTQTQKDAKINQLNKKITNLNTKINELQVQNQVFASLVQQKQKIIKKNQINETFLSQELKKYQELYKQSQKQRNKYLTQMQVIINEKLAAMGGIIKDISCSRNNLSSSSQIKQSQQMLKVQLNQLKREIDISNGQKQQLVAQNQRLFQKLNQLRQQISMYQQSDIKTHILAKQQQINTKHQLQLYHQKTTQLQQQLKLLQFQLHCTKQQNHQLQTKLKQKQSLLITSKQQLSKQLQQKYSTKITSLTIELQKHKNQLQLLKTQHQNQLNSLIQQIDKKFDEKNQYQFQQINSLHQQNQAIRQESICLEKQVILLKSDIEFLRNDLNKVTEVNRLLEGKNAELIKRNQQIEVHRFGLEREVGQYQSKNQTYLKQSQKLKQMQQKLLKIRQKYQNQLTNLQKEFQLIFVQINKKNETIIELTQRVECLKKQKQELETLLEQYWKQSENRLNYNFSFQQLHGSTGNNNNKNNINTNQMSTPQSRSKQPSQSIINQTYINQLQTQISTLQQQIQTLELQNKKLQLIQKQKQQKQKQYEQHFLNIQFQIKVKEEFFYEIIVEMERKIGQVVKYGQALLVNNDQGKNSYEFVNLQFQFLQIKKLNLPSHSQLIQQNNNKKFVYNSDISKNSINKLQHTIQKLLNYHHSILQKQKQTNLFINKKQQQILKLTNQLSSINFQLNKIKIRQRVKSQSSQYRFNQSKRIKSFGLLLNKDISQDYLSSQRNQSDIQFLTNHKNNNRQKNGLIKNFNSQSDLNILRSRNQSSLQKSLIQQTSIIKYSKIIQKLRQKLTKKNQRLTKTMQQLQTLKHQTKQHQSQNHKLKQQIKRLNNKISQQEQKIQEEHKISKSLEQKTVKQLTDQIRELKQIVQKLDSENQKLRQRLKRNLEDMKNQSFNNSNKEKQQQQQYFRRSNVGNNLNNSNNRLLERSSNNNLMGKK